MSASRRLFLRSHLHCFRSVALFFPTPSIIVILIEPYSIYIRTYVRTALEGYYNGDPYRAVRATRLLLLLASVVTNP
jgi:hypothetical protein